MRFVRFLSYFTCALFFSAPLCSAQDNIVQENSATSRLLSSQVAGGNACNVTVRVINGSGSAAGEKLAFAEELSDVKDQLRALPFSMFTVIQTESERIKLREAGQFRLIDADNQRHILRLTPLAVIGEKVRIFVNWTGPRGETILATQLKIDNSQAMLWGTDRSPGSTIMSVRLECRGGDLK